MITWHNFQSMSEVLIVFFIFCHCPTHILAEKFCKLEDIITLAKCLIYIRSNIITGSMISLIHIVNKYLKKRA